jgi:hypothetical protein
MSDDIKLVRQVGKYTIKVIQSKCIAAASCVAISPLFSNSTNRTSDYMGTDEE